jgi:hypothetical protein
MMQGIMYVGANLTQGARNNLLQSDGSAVGTQAPTTWIVPSWPHPLCNVLAHGKVTVDTCYDRTHLDGNDGTSPLVNSIKCNRATCAVTDGASTVNGPPGQEKACALYVPGMLTQVLINTNRVLAVVCSQQPVERRTENAENKPPKRPPDKTVGPSGARIDENWPNIHGMVKKVGRSFLATKKENLHAVHGELAHFHTVTCYIPQPDLQTDNLDLQMQDAWWLSTMVLCGFHYKASQ